MGVFENVKPHQLSAENGFIALMCPDCDQSIDRQKHLWEVSNRKCGVARVHPFSLHGGGLVLAPNSPVSVGRYNGEMTIEQFLLLHQIRDAMTIKNMDTFVIGCHAPCAAAARAHLSFIEVLRHTFAAKRWLKSMIPELRIACFPHIHYPKNGEEDKRRTYFCSMENFQRFDSCMREKAA